MYYSSREMYFTRHAKHSQVAMQDFGVEQRGVNYEGQLCWYIKEKSLLREGRRRLKLPKIKTIQSTAVVQG